MVLTILFSSLFSLVLLLSKWVLYRKRLGFKFGLQTMWEPAPTQGQFGDPLGGNFQIEAKNQVPPQKFLPILIFLEGI